MLDDANILKQRDPDGALEIVGQQYKQEKYEVEIRNANHDNREIRNIVFAGMGGSALAALLVRKWLKTELSLPFEIFRSYDLPEYVGHNSLVILSSYSGNAEETLSSLNQAIARGAQIAVITSGGILFEKADANQITCAALPKGLQPRMAVIDDLRALVKILVNFNTISSERLDEIGSTSDWIREESSKWLGDIPTDQNYAKQLAQKIVGKTAVFYGGTLTAPVAYKWKISINENAKNMAFWNELPEANHNEFIGWTSHPVEKPFAVFDIVSSFENPKILRRFEITDRLLSGKRPKATEINLVGDSTIKQLLWGSILADFVGIYLAILNNVNPMPVELIEKLKKEIAQS